jgi:hypothetical protein
MVSIDRDLWSPEMKAFLKDVITKGTKADLDRVARLCAFKAFQQYYRAEPNKGVVWHAAFNALHHIRDVLCEVERAGGYLNQSYEAVVKLAERRPPFQCDIEAAPPVAAKTDKAPSRRRRCAG